MKRFDLLVHALPSLPGVTAVLVGDGPERVSLESLAAKLGVSDRLQLALYAIHKNLQTLE